MKKTNEFTACGILCQNVTLFYRHELASLNAGKIESVQEIKIKIFE